MTILGAAPILRSSLEVLNSGAAICPKRVWLKLGSAATATAKPRIN